MLNLEVLFRPLFGNLLPDILFAYMVVNGFPPSSELREFLFSIGKNPADWVDTLLPFARYTSNGDFVLPSFG
jgi:hypothetical protein